MRNLLGIRWFGEFYVRAHIGIGSGGLIGLFWPQRSASLEPMTSSN